MRISDTLSGVASEVLTGGGKDCCRLREEPLPPTGWRGTVIPLASSRAVKPRPHSPRRAPASDVNGTLVIRRQNLTLRLAHGRRDVDTPASGEKVPRVPGGWAQPRCKNDT